MGIKNFLHWYQTVLALNSSASVKAQILKHKLITILT